MFEYQLLNLLIYLLISLYIYLSWVILFKKITSLKWDVFALAFIGFLTQVILSELFLGLILDRLFLLELIILNLSISTIMLFVSRSVILSFITDISKIPHILIRLVRSNLWLNLLILILTTTIIINLLVIIVVWAPTSWDDYHYHIGFIADILQTGEVRYFDYTHDYTISFPHNIELTALWQMIFFDNDFFIEFTNLLYIFYSSIILVLFSRSFKFKDSITLLMASLPFFIPMNALLINTTKVDFAVGTLFLGSLYFLIKIDYKKILSRSSLVYLIMSALSIGIIFGSKSSGVLYAVIWSIGFTSLLISNSWSKIKSPKELVKPLFIGASALLMAMILLGAFWYFRSWYHFDNPLYPLSISVLGVELPGSWGELAFDTNVPQVQEFSMLQRIIYVWRERDAWSGYFYIADGKTTGMGSLWYILLFPSMLISFFLAFLRRDQIFFILLSLFGLLFLLIPGNWIPHYTSFISYAGILSLGYILTFGLKNNIQRNFIVLITILLMGVNFLLTYNSSYYNWEDTVERVSEGEFPYIPSSRKFVQSNILINRTLEDGDIVVVGYGVYFPYALIKNDLDTRTIYIPFESGDQWLNDVKELNPRFIMVFNDSPEHDLLINDSQFEHILTEPDGPAHLYANLGNSKNGPSDEVVLYDFETDSEVPEPISNYTLRDLKVVSKYGVLSFEVEFQMERSEISEPIIFLHVVDEGQDEGEYTNLDFIPSEISDNSIVGQRDLPISSEKFKTIRFGIYDPENNISYYEDEIRLEQY